MSNEEAPQQQPAAEATPPSDTNKPAPAPEPPKQEEDKKRKLNPADAARDAIFGIVREADMTPDEKVSAIAPLLKTLCEHGDAKEVRVKHEFEHEPAPRAQRRISMLEEAGKVIPKPNGPPPDQGVLKPLS